MEKKELNLFLGQIFGFIIVQALGLITGLRFFSLPQFKERITIPALSIPEFLAAFIAAILFIVIFLKFFKKRRIPFKLLFYFLIFIVGSLTFLIWLPDNPLAFLFVLALFLLLHFFPNVLVQNLCLTICVIGAGVFLGASLFPGQLIIILAILIIYDLVMVLGTGQMVKMFKAMLAQKLILALTIPSEPKGLTTKISEVELGKGFIFLGTGDLALPMALAVSVLRESLTSALFVLFGSLIGLIFLSFYFLKERRPLPALPPIITGAFLGYLISLFLF